MAEEETVPQSGSLQLQINGTELFHSLTPGPSLPHQGSVQEVEREAQSVFCSIRTLRTGRPT